MCTYIIFFHSWLYSAVVKVSISSPKTARNEHVCAHKSPTVSKFSKIFFEPFYAGWTVVVHLCCGFSLWREMAPQQSAKFRTAFLVNFVPVWGRIASPIMHRFGRVFDIYYGTRMYFAKH